VSKNWQKSSIRKTNYNVQDTGLAIQANPVLSSYTPP